MDPEHVKILLDIRQDIGSMKAVMHEARVDRERMEEKLDCVQRGLLTIEPVIQRVEKNIEPDIKELKDFKTKIGAYLVAGTTFFSAVLWLIWSGLSYWSAELKAFFTRLFH